MRLLPWSRRKREEELDEELRSHLQMAVQERVERGETPEQAEVSARREFGNMGLIKEVTRGTWGLVWLAQLVQDFRYGLRMLRREAGFTTVAVLTLALGIGANTAIFSVINALILNPPHIVEAERVAALWRTAKDKRVEGYFSYLGLQDRHRRRCATQQFDQGGGARTLFAVSAEQLDLGQFLCTHD
jgi:hypothetical protein